MINNDILRRLRYALNINDQKMIEIVKLSEFDITLSQLTAYLKKEEEEGFQECSNETMRHFLDGLIIFKRGKREQKPWEVKKPDPPINNNTILKKIRIALEFKEEDMLAVLRLGGVEISASELSALFRAEGHKHYKPCGDQFLRNFLKGLVIKYRGPSTGQAGDEA